MIFEDVAFEDVTESQIAASQDLAEDPAASELSLVDRLCQTVERHPLAVFGLQAFLAVGIALACRTWLASRNPIAADLPAVPLPPVAAELEYPPTTPPARPHARFAPERIAAEIPPRNVDRLLMPDPAEDLAWTPATLPDPVLVALPKGGRNMGPVQKAEVERDHKKFLSSLETYLTLQATIGGLAISPEDDPLTSPRPPLNNARSMSERIDQWLVRGWHSAGIIPAPAASDEELLRRLYLDLTGIIPSLDETRAYLVDSRRDKREQLIDTLLASPAHAEHLASQWLNVMLPVEEDMNSNFERWLRLKFQKNIRYDRVIGEIINPGPMSGGAAGLYNARRGMPEELAADTARVLLGVQIQCAQCHAHPFDRWTVEDFKGYVAFFKDAASFRNLEAPPRFLGGEVVEVKSVLAARQALAEWMTSLDNPYFARATVNRLWAMMFGRGLVNPIDDLSPNHPPSHPQLLDELSAYFMASGYDVRGMLRTLARTRGYQLSSQTPVDDPTDGEMFASMTIKNLSTRTMIDCLAQVMDDRLVGSPRPRGRDDTLRREFLERFGVLARGGSDYEGGIPQALWMMNGPVMNQLSQSMLVKSLSEPKATNEARVATLFLTALSRFPQPHEQAGFVKHLEKHGTSKRQEALADLLWALLNSAEFTMNH